MLGAATVGDRARRAGGDDVAAATRDARWAPRWQGWADWPLTPLTLAAAAVAVALDVASAWTGVGLGSVGGIAVSPGLPFALLAAATIGAARLGGARAARTAWREFALGGGAVLAVAVLADAGRLGRPAQSVGLVLDAAGEELVFRLAAVVVLGAVAARVLGRPWRTPRQWGAAPGFLALGGAAVVFSALPGHVEQMTGVTTILPFASVALLFGYVVLRTGALWPTVLVHALLNITTVAAWEGAASPTARAVIAVVALVALVTAAHVAGRRLGLQQRVPDVIDLRAVTRPEPVGERRLR